MAVAAEEQKENHGYRKAAILLITIGAEKAAAIYRHLRDEEVERLSMEIAALGTIPSTEKKQVLREFFNMYMTREYAVEGGVEYANSILSQVLGRRRAEKVMKRVTALSGEKIFSSLRKADTDRMAMVLRSEHPQAAALVLSHLPSRQAAEILSVLPEEQQLKVATRIAATAHSSPETLREVERVLETKIMRTNVGTIDGIGTLADILAASTRAAEKAVMEHLTTQDSDLAQAVRDKMFVFEDIHILEERLLQNVLRNIDNRVLALALKGADEHIRNVIFNNVTKRNQEMIAEEIDIMGTVRTRDVENAQQEIVQEVRRVAEESGDIDFMRQGGATIG